MNTSPAVPAWPQRLLDAGAFALLALALLLPSGYAIGALLLLAAGMARWPQLWRQRRLDAASMDAWAAAIAAMTLAWAMHTVEGGEILWKFPVNSLGMDRCMKYLLMLLALPAFYGARPRLAVLRWGCWLGAAGAGLLALWQTLARSMPRAEGHTNAIQFGSIVLLLGMWGAAWALHARSAGAPRVLRAAGWAAAALGLAACILSGSRGVWLALPLLAFMLALLAAALHARAVRRAAPAVLAATAASVLLLALPPVQERATLALHEWQQAQSAPAKADTSIGLRRAFWSVAWELGRAHPLVGAGQLGYERAQEEAAVQRRIPVHAVMFNHAHNEWLDVWAKRGLLGCVALALFYAVPAALLWRHWRAALRPGAHAGGAARATAALCGLMMVAGYLVFGMTQVMFVHNNSNMVYLFGVSVWLAASAPEQEGAA